VPSKILCAHGAYIRTMLEDRHAFGPKSRTYYVADLRFKKQIILIKNKEQDSGKCIF
jgi:hypothetical protein